MYDKLRVSVSRQLSNLWQLSKMKLSDSKSLLASLFLLLAAIGSIALMLHSHPNNNSLPTVVKNAQPDAFIKNATILTFDKNGQQQSYLQTQQMLHYQEHNMGYYIHPQLITQTQNHQAWKIVANYAKSSDGNKQVFLWDHVQIDQLNNNGAIQASIFTTSLLAFPQNQFASTDQTVQIINGNNKINGDGLEADLKTGSFHILKNTVGVITPNDLPKNEKPPAPHSLAHSHLTKPQSERGHLS